MLVSVIMPAHNVAKFIEESIDSVFKQTISDWELIIVDDCSTDNTVELINPYLKDVRVTLIQNKENKGGAASRNVAINQAQGRYIAFLDSDDLWEPKKLETQIYFMKKNGIGFSFGAHTTIDERGNVFETINVPAKVDFKMLLKHNYIGCLTAIYDTKPHGKVYMPLVKKRQDFALWLVLLRKFQFAYSVKQNLGFYRIRSGSLSRSKADAIKYYWLVLRDVGGCGKLYACFNLLSYLIIVFIKKKNVKLYNKVFIG